MLTCPCGARFEVDDSLAEREVLCPDCQQPVQAPQTDLLPRVTSAWALASVVLALVGAFTVVGTIVAVVLGLVALVNISRRRDRVTGAGFAVLGICLGILFTVLTVVALNAGDLFGLESWVHERALTKNIDTSGPLEVVQRLKGFAITRPNEKWGQVPHQISGDPAVALLQDRLDLLLMRIVRHAFIDVRTLQPLGPPPRTLDECEQDVLSDFEVEVLHRPRNPFDDDEDDVGHPMRIRRLGERRLEAKDGMEGREIEVEVRCAGKPWHFLIRLYRLGNGRVYVVRAYAPKRRFDEVRGELETALDSFRILRR